jgi:hypothetical protein
MTKKQMEMELNEWDKRAFMAQHNIRRLEMAIGLLKEGKLDNEQQKRVFDTAIQLLENDTILEDYE